MYDEDVKLKIYKWVSNNRNTYNEYQRQKQKEYYHQNKNQKLKKHNDYIFRKISNEFRNILL